MSSFINRKKRTKHWGTFIIWFGSKLRFHFPVCIIRLSQSWLMTVIFLKQNSITIDCIMVDRPVLVAKLWFTSNYCGIVMLDLNMGQHWLSNIDTIKPLPERMLICISEILWPGRIPQRLAKVVLCIMGLKCVHIKLQQYFQGSSGFTIYFPLLYSYCTLKHNLWTLHSQW